MGVENIRVFGSVARGEAHSDSDVDLLVDVPLDVRGFDLFGTLDDVGSELARLLDCHVDVLSIREVAPLARREVERIKQEAVAL